MAIKADQHAYNAEYLSSDSYQQVLFKKCHNVMISIYLQDVMDDKDMT